MAVMDEFKEEREAIKKAPLGKRVEYFFDYYKWHTIIIIVSVIAICAFIYEVSTNKDTGFEVAIINAYTDDVDASSMIEEFLPYLDIDTSKEEMIIDDTYYLDYINQDTNHATFLQKLITLVSTKVIDVMAADEVTYARLAYINMFMDLEECMSEEFLEEYADQIVYIDQVMLDKMEESSDDMTEEDYIIGDASDMEEPVAVGIYVDENSKLYEYYSFMDEPVVIGVVGNTTHLESAIAFVEYALD